MYVVVHEGAVAASQARSIGDALGPDSGLGRERSLEPGYLGSLLLVGPPASEQDASILLLEMWDDRVGPVSANTSPEVAVSVEWRGGPRVFVAVR